MSAIEGVDHSNNQTGNTYLDALIWGHQWDLSSPLGGGSNVLTYTFENGELGYMGWYSHEMAAMESVLSSISDVCNISFQKVAFSAANFVWGVTDWSGGLLGMHGVPGQDSTLGIVSEYMYPNTTVGLFDASWMDAGGVAVGSLMYSTMVHEVLHGLGLSHPHDSGGGSGLFPGVGSSTDTGTFGANQGINTIMSYNDGWNGLGFCSTPMALDIAVLQHLYGAASNNTGNDVYSITEVSWSCIWDTGGTDTISAAGITESVLINLDYAPLSGSKPGGKASAVKESPEGGFTIANGVTIENAIGGDGFDKIKGNVAQNVLEGGKGRDRLWGFGNDDTLIGGYEKDHLWGGNGADTFKYEDNRDLKANRHKSDIIWDFQQGSDKIDLSLLDASFGLDGNNTFLFVGTSNISKNPNGEIRFKKFDFANDFFDKTVIYIDNDGDNLHEKTITLKGLYDLTADDFIL